MTMHPDALDRIVEADPWEAARARYAELATDDRPGDPLEIPFDPRPRRGAIIVTAVQLIVCALPVLLAWAVLS
jgi:hypothetical protein